MADCKTRPWVVDGRGHWWKQPPPTRESKTAVVSLAVEESDGPTAVAALVLAWLRQESLADSLPAAGEMAAWQTGGPGMMQSLEALSDARTRCPCCLPLLLLLLVDEVSRWQYHHPMTLLLLLVVWKPLVMMGGEEKEEEGEGMVVVVVMVQQWRTSVARQWVGY